MKRVFFALFETVHNLLQSPLKVLWICLGLAFVNLILDGSLYRYYSLTQDLVGIQDDIEVIKLKNQKLSKQLQATKDPGFLEREARERFDLVRDGDLVFVFSDDSVN